MGLYDREKLALLAQSIPDLTTAEVASELLQLLAVGRGVLLTAG